MRDAGVLGWEGGGGGGGNYEEEQRCERGGRAETEGNMSTGALTFPHFDAHTVR